MMDPERRTRQIAALAQAMAQPLFDEAIADLRARLATEIADCMDPDTTAALKAERFALNRLRGRLQSFVNEQVMGKPNAT